MKRTTLTISIGALILAGAGFANAEASNPAVKERQALMGTLRSNFGTLGGMAQGKVDFDAAKAAAAQAAVIEAAGMIPAKFEANESDPESKAAPAIWQNWDDFTADAMALKTAAEGMDVSSLDAIKAGFGPVGGACGACHQSYRLK